MKNNKFCTALCLVTTPRSRIIGSLIGLIDHVIPMLSYDNLSRDWSRVTAYFIRGHCRSADLTKTFNIYK